MLELWFREFIDKAGPTGLTTDVAGRAAAAGVAAADPVAAPVSA